MSDESEDGAIREPMIRFGGEWVPAHDLWDKMETANVVTDAIERFNEHFPQLASDATREVVPLVRQRLKDIELRMPERQRKPDLAGIALRLLGDMSPEDVLAVLREQHATDVDTVALIQLAGETPYLDALRREGTEFAANRISPEQTAQLWNGSGRPAPGGGLWTEKKVSTLLYGA